MRMALWLYALGGGVLLGVKDMILWTWQGEGHSLTEGSIDHAKSPYWEDPKIMRAYCELEKRLKVKGIVWCCTRLDKRIRVASDYNVAWVLDVPLSEFLRIVDGEVWERIIESGAISERLGKLWRSEGWSLFPGDVELQSEHKARREKDYLAEPAPSGGWWSLLYANETTPDAARVVLLNHPIDCRWVKKTKACTVGDTPANIAELQL